MDHCSPSARIDLVELNYPQLFDRGRAVFEHLTHGDVVILRDVPEVKELRRQLIERISRNWGEETARQVLAFLERNEPVPSPPVVAFLIEATQMRDRRTLSHLFAPLIEAMDPEGPWLIDTGHFRCISTDPDHRQAASEFAKGGWVPPQAQGPEGFLCTMTPEDRYLPNIHRDITFPHTTFQFNLWFPLHDMEEDEVILLFPETYRDTVSLYRKDVDPSAPNSWGYGPKLDFSLGFGDIVLFHEQHVHGSPSAARTPDRTSIEIRIAADCHDDNATVYRRLFWRSENLANLPEGATLDSVPTASPMSASDWFNAHFKNPADARLAGDLWSGSDCFGSVEIPTDQAATTIVTDLKRLTCGPDLMLATGRMLESKGFPKQALDVYSLTVDATDGYFFALEAGRRAWGLGGLEIAERSLHRAEQLARHTDVRLGKWMNGIEPALNKVIQLLPADALRAVAVLRPALDLARTGQKDAQDILFEYRIACPKIDVAWRGPFGVVLRMITGFLFVPAQSFGTDLVLRDLVVNGNGVQTFDTQAEVEAYLSGFAADASTTVDMRGP